VLTTIIDLSEDRRIRLLEESRFNRTPGIVFVRMRCDHRTREDLERRAKERMSRKEIMRYLGRYVARGVYQCLASAGTVQTGP